MKGSFLGILLFCFVNEGLLSPTPATAPITTQTPTPPTTPISTQVPGCEFEGNVYPPGADIPELSGQSDNWCYGAYCSEEFGSYSIIQWDNFNCGVETTLPTTPGYSSSTPPPITPTPPTA